MRRSLRLSCARSRSRTPWTRTGAQKSNSSGETCRCDACGTDTLRELENHKENSLQHPHHKSFFLPLCGRHFLMLRVFSHYAILAIPDANLASFLRTWMFPMPYALLSGPPAVEFGIRCDVSDRMLRMLAKDDLTLSLASP